MRPLTTYELDDSEKHMDTIKHGCTFYFEDHLRRQMMQGNPTPFRLLRQLENKTKAEFRNSL
jgi:hypothetical protein